MVAWAGVKGASSCQIPNGWSVGVRERKARDESSVYGMSNWRRQPLLTESGRL